MDSERRGADACINDDALLDAYALVAAYLNGDHQAQETALAGTGLRQLTAAMTAMTAGTLMILAREWGGDATELLTVQQIADLAKMILTGGLRAVGAPEPPLPAYLTADPAAQAPVATAPDEADINRTAAALLAAALDDDNRRATQLLTGDGAHPLLGAAVAARLAGLFAGAATADSDIRAWLEGHMRQLAAGDDGTSSPAPGE